MHNAYLLSGGGMSGAHVPFRSRLYISGCIMTTRCSIAVIVDRHLEHRLELPGRGHPVSVTDHG